MPLAQGFDYYFGPLGANDGGGVKFHQNNEAAGTTRDMGSLTRLDADIGEKTNLANKHPEKLAELKKLFNTIDTSEKPHPPGINAR